MSRRGIFLNGWFEAGCHTAAFSTHHSIQADGICAWCKRSADELEKAGAKWIDVLGRVYKRPDLSGEAP